ncbi:MAG TPA: hypothetical protein DD653_07530, partial [Marinilabiliales bacterium]|nr:hypothetical protein [Marinilabiliales bacterium]
FSGLRTFVFQTNFSNGGYEHAPKTQPFHTANRWLQFRKYISKSVLILYYLYLYLYNIKYIKNFSHVNYNTFGF